MKLNCDDINSICGDEVESFLANLDSSAETKLTTGHTLRYDEHDGEWIWSRDGCCGPAAEMLYLETTRLSTSIDDDLPVDDYRRAVAAAIQRLVVG
jgi:hypothetical protein